VAAETQISDFTGDSAIADTDVFWKESATNVNEKITGSELKAAVAPIFGSEFQQESSLTESQSTSDAFTQKVRLTTPSGLTAGKYRIGVQYSWWSSSSTQDFIAQVQLNDTTVLWSHQQEPQDTGSDQKVRSAGFIYYDLSAGVNTIDLDWRGSLSGNTYAIADARLEFWRVE
jgi:hypothetical protein